MWIVILESYTEDRSKAKKSDGSVKNSGKILLFYFASNTQYYSEWSCLKTYITHELSGNFVAL